MKKKRREGVGWWGERDRRIDRQEKGRREGEKKDLLEELTYILLDGD